MYLPYDKQNIYPMKKIFLLFSLTAFIALPAVQMGAATCPPGGDGEIIIKEDPLPEDDRGPAPAHAFLVAGDISITLVSSLGVTSITVLNSQDQTVYYTSVDAALTGTVQFAAPITPDTYTLIIQSSSYYGVGIFSIQ